MTSDPCKKYEQIATSYILSVYHDLYLNGENFNVLLSENVVCISKRLSLKAFGW